MQLRRPYVDDRDFRLFVGEARAVLAELPADSVDCVVTSPPYWGLRDYGTGGWEGGDPACLHSTGKGSNVRQSKHQQGADYPASPAHRGGNPRECLRCGAVRVDQQVGLEASPAEFVAAIVAVFAEVRRVLAPHGTLWLNLGDSYASGASASARGNPGAARASRPRGGLQGGTRTVDVSLGAGGAAGLKAKDLVGIPWRVAFALQEAGWHLRSDIVWAKPNPMPESVGDRPTKSHEYVFLLTKQPRYYFDQEAVREPHGGRASGNTERKHGAAVGAPNARPGDLGRSIPWTPPAEVDPAVLTLGDLPPEAPRGPDGRRKLTHAHGVPNSHDNYSNMATDQDRWPHGGRNIRTVWEIATQPYPEAHFATFPEALPERCIKAGCPEQVCRTCGKPRERLVGVAYANPGNRSTNGPRSVERVHQGFGSSAGFAQRLERRTTTAGWTDCGHDDYRAGVVLDPFMGSGTTALVARRLGRHAVGIELNPEYAALAAKRNAQQTIFA